MIRSTLFLSLSCTGILLLGALLIYGQPTDGAAHGKQQLVRTFGLTDLALFSEASYTRHPSQADLFSAFQVFPAVLEHFPSGSFTAPAPIGQTRRIAIQKPTERQL